VGLVAWVCPCSIHVVFPVAIFVGCIHSRVVLRLLIRAACGHELNRSRFKGAVLAVSGR
jgi:hypothetical protein